MNSSQKQNFDPKDLQGDLTTDQTLGLVSLSLMQKLSKKDPSLNWLSEEFTEKTNLQNLRNRLEITDLALKTGAPLSTSEVTLILGAKPGSSKTERGGLIATRISRNIWKITKKEHDNNYWRN
tara:strand:+ start:15931 stop:16299 length:369 start_codon:yes stop_codon:yes gene_type:complete